MLRTGHRIQNEEISEKFFSKNHLEIIDMIDELVIVFLIDSTEIPGKIIYANRMAVKLLGYSLKDLKEKSFYDLVRDFPTDNKIRQKKRFNCDFITFSGSKLSLFGTVGFIKRAGRSLGVYIGKDNSKTTRLLEELRWRVSFENLIAKISSMFVGAFDFDDAVNRSLESIGKFTGADRAYLFLFSEDGKSMSNTHEWCAEGITPEKDMLQNLPVDTFPWWMRKLKAGKIINIENVSKLPDEASAEKEILQAQDIKSLIVLPVFTGKELAGFIGLDDVDRNVPWKESDITLLKVFSEILSRALEIKKGA
ncbi:GAF domain-containing protein [Kosmotoga pacifica]|uniref:GAF domain-containing protein n=1 Tax=Kosmotoga pacifica TaxID=1330330 RepID=UPI0006998460|nr:GAF domain-containing protein [Kosmotoga pacifica]